VVRPGLSIVSRLLRLALAASLLASGSLHFHPGEPLGANSEDFGSRAELRSAASHPHAPLHVESVKLERAPRCLECLLRQRDHARTPPATLANLEPWIVGTAALTGPSVLRRAADPGQPRGPPLL
jgi:hypothetical protein